MPITRSAKKALRQSRRKRIGNRARKDALANAIKLYKKLAKSREAEKAASQLRVVYQTLDKAAKTRAIPKNRASRLKSRLAQLSAKSSKASS